MRVFFNVSSRCTPEINATSRKIYEIILRKGHKHTYDCFLDEKKYRADEQDEDKLFTLYSTAIKALTKSDVIVLEVSTNSFTQGYILQKALELNKPVIALHQQGKYSIFVKGIKSSLLQTVEYTDYNLETALSHALKFATENLQSKFNFYLSQDIGNYLKWTAKHKNISKSAVVRQALRERMNADTEYTLS